MPAELVITPVDDHVKRGLISQLINGISRVYKKLLKYFSGTTISTFFILPPLGIFPAIFFKSKGWAITRKINNVAIIIT